MKSLCAFLLFAASALAADFTTGQAARLVIGQTTFTAQSPTSSDTVVGGVSGLAYAANTLFVADSNRVGADPSNHRVLIYKNLSDMVPAPTAELTQGAKCPACIGQASLVLGQPDFSTFDLQLTPNNTNLRLPTAVASDGVRLAVADTDHNRVLIWNSFPTSNNAPADVVLGQPNFATVSVPSNGVPSATSLRGPQGVWFQDGKLFVADTQNNRVLIWNRVPTTNGAPADVVLGQPNFTTFVQVDISQQTTTASATNMLNPVSVTSDGLRLFVSDLGFNRVLVWNTIPTSNAAPANIALGQPDLNSSFSNYGYRIENSVQVPVLCTTSNGKDSNGNPTYPEQCNATLSFPRFVLAAANRLFVADGGNDRVLIFNKMPGQNGAPADVVLGQIGSDVNQASDAADSMRSPMSLAWDGTNLYVSDAFNRRVLVYAMGETAIPYTGVRNGASLDVVATGSITVAGTITAGDKITFSVGANALADKANYVYTVKTSDKLSDIVLGLVDVINSANDGAGDPYLRAAPKVDTLKVLLTAKQSGEAGNNVSLSSSLSKNATVIIGVSSTTLTGGGDAAKVAPGALVTIFAKDDKSPLTFTTAVADWSQDALPNDLGGTQVYLNGVRAPLLYVSPTQVNAQIPWEVADTTSINAYVRAVKPSGEVVVTTPVAATIVAANPGIFIFPGPAPQEAIALHASSHAMGLISVDGTATADFVATVNIAGRTYSYTVVDGDDLVKVRDGLVAAINNGNDPEVYAEASGTFTRIILKAKVEGPVGNGIRYGVGENGDTSAGETGVLLSAFSADLCCANVPYSLVTQDNPAAAGENIIVYATGVGVPDYDPTTEPDLLKTGVKYPLDGRVTAPPQAVFMNSLSNNVTVNVLGARLVPGSVGLYEILLNFSTGAGSDPRAQLWIAQGEFISNVVTLPVFNPSGTQ